MFPLKPFMSIMKRRFHAGLPCLTDFETVHIQNTNKYKQLLMEKGHFEDAQANAIVNLMSDALRGGISHIAQDLAKRERLTQLTYQQRVDFAKLRDQLLTADRTEFHNLQNEYERVRKDVDKLKNKVREDITKANASFKLDLSLEKGRIREESSHHDIQIKEIDTRIDKEVTNMRMQIDSVKTQVMQWLIGVCTGTFALVLAYVRLLS
ncbi:probable protein FMP32, mitochondrial [Zygosaccharomyces bailii]|uniref:ZYBA0S15-01178g1_1 n=1 Tax=Zygosaccharomyces bailii (strain CLIB 213 / ATCC 58445 / CBS 680 / BCRC 21525 / NBRC 1098 / NCYC 1416 / NRRL Y-2227) TaxID=1333698 RepID=A0A8J2TBU0_ZYGB2|nr:ZYBA0S15-01178g1_1 [Zygosaccharomyces bailii CLIB 213]SJM88459.1 probable protein FMP32, mitochondrial [Zygosaccharomyces bailii]